MSHRLARLVITCLMVLLLAGCVGAEGPPTDPTATRDGTTTAQRPSRAATGPSPSADSRSALVATAVVDEVEVFAAPDGAGDPSHVLEHPTPVGAPRVFLVEQRRAAWLEVLLPVRPNGSTGWIRSSDVDLARTSYRVEVDLSAFRLRVLDGEDVVIDTEVGYGADDTPTPGGDYYVTELLRPPDPDGVYGPYAFGLSGFSDVHLDFAGGDGVIGIHGTNDPASIGNRVSNGCIRVDNATIAEMADMLPLGTPVAILA